MNSILVIGLLSPFTVINFGFQDVFHSCPKLAIVGYGTVVWYELVWKGKCGLNSLINPTVLAWLSFVVSLAMCEPAIVPYSLWESCPSRGWQRC